MGDSIVIEGVLSGQHITKQLESLVTLTSSA